MSLLLPSPSSPSLLHLESLYSCPRSSLNKTVKSLLRQCLLASSDTISVLRSYPIATIRETAEIILSKDLDWKAASLPAIVSYLNSVLPTHVPTLLCSFVPESLPVFYRIAEEGTDLEAVTRVVERGENWAVDVLLKAGREGVDLLCGAVKKMKEPWQGQFFQR